MLADRAARDWAGAAVASAQVGAPNALEDLPTLGKPEHGSETLDWAAQQVRDAASSPEMRELGYALVELARALPEIDTEATAAGNRKAFEAVAGAAATVLLKAAFFLGGEDFVEAQSNAMLDDLVGLPGWQNQLGPRYE